VYVWFVSEGGFEPPPGASRTRRLAGILEIATVVAALITVPLTIAQIRGATGPFVDVLDWGIWLVFLADFTVALAVADDRWRAAGRNWLTLIVIVLSFPALPALLALTRLARLVRLARLFRAVRLIAILTRGFQGVRRALGHRGLVYVAVFALALVIGGGAAMTVVEPETVDGSFFGGVWWPLVTLTTVGYGDISPTTVAGRLIAAGLMLVGIGLVGTLATSVAAYFVAQQSEKPDAQEPSLREIEARLERIERLLERGTRGRSSE
jgi:voltage-gated potassium channel